MDRRDFLKGSAAVGLSSVFSSLEVESSSKKKDEETYGNLLEREAAAAEEELNGDYSLSVNYEGRPLENSVSLIAPIEELTGQEQNIRVILEQHLRDEFIEDMSKPLSSAIQTVMESDLGQKGPYETYKIEEQKENPENYFSNFSIQIPGSYSELEITLDYGAQIIKNQLRKDSPEEVMDNVINNQPDPIEVSHNERSSENYPESWEYVRRGEEIEHSGNTFRIIDTEDDLVRVGLEDGINFTQSPGANDKPVYSEGQNLPFTYLEIKEVDPVKYQNGIFVEDISDKFGVADGESHL